MDGIIEQITFFGQATVVVVTRRDNPTLTQFDGTVGASAGAGDAVDIGAKSGWIPDQYKPSLILTNG